MCSASPLNTITKTITSELISLIMMGNLSWLSWLMCVYFIIAGPLMHLNMQLPSSPALSGRCAPLAASVLLFLTEFSEHIWSEDKRGWRDGAKRRRGEWGANGEGCEQAEDEHPQPSIITVSLMRNASSFKIGPTLLWLTFDPLGLNQVDY